VIAPARDLVCREIIQHYDVTLRERRVRYDDGGKLKLQLVRETKGTTKLEQLQFSSEGRKIKCAMKHFQQLGIDYRHITGKELRWRTNADSDDPTKMFK
jgi:restriction endonuclease